ncbi:MAG: hypothetical protein QM564_06755 [Bergeyella sp.]
MVVAGAIESRGGTYIKKSNNADKSNEGANLNVRLDNNYTALDNRVENGNIYFESEKKGSLGASQDTSFIFSNKSSSNTAKLGINSKSDPQGTFHMADGTAVFGNLAHRYPCT